MTHLRATLLARSRGQALVIAVLVLPVLLAFTLLVVEVAERWLEVAMIEDALQQATRSAVQTIDYAPLAAGEDRIRASAACEGVTVARAAGGPCADVIAVADAFFRVNLQQARGLVGASPEAAIATAAAQVRWSVYPEGGSCAYSDGTSVSSAHAPLICAELRPTMRGLVGWGIYTPLIVAADTLDAVTF